MTVEVTLHPLALKEFFAPIDLLYAGLSKQLLEDFKQYILSNRTAPPTYFGRDAVYTQPSAAERAHLMHIHIKLPPGSFPQDRAQYYRTCLPGRPGEDAALVYVQGELYEERYQLLAFLWPDAHGKARQPDLMRYLARLAEDFRTNN